NGFSLARRVLLEEGNLSMTAAPKGLERTLADELLEPTRIYVKEILALLAHVDVKGMAHVTGGGLPGNVPRCLPQGTRALLDPSTWPLPPIFRLISDLGSVERTEMYRTFNMGLGFVVVVAPHDVPTSLRLLREQSIPAWEVGRVEAGEGEPTARVL